MRKKKFYSIFFLMMLVTSSFAQKYFPGIEVGHNYSKLIFFQSKYYSYKPGYSFGLSVDRYITNSFFLHFGAKRSIKAFDGSKSREKWNSTLVRSELYRTDKEFSGEFYEGLVSIVKYHKGFIFSFGAEYFFLNSYDYSGQTNIFYEEELLGSKDQTTEVEGISKSGINAFFSLGYRLPAGMGLSINTSLASGSFATSYKWHNLYSMGISVSYTFNNKKYINGHHIDYTREDKSTDYRIIKKLPVIDRVLFIEKDKDDNKILFSFEQDGSFYKDMPGLVVTGSNGEFVKTANEIGFHFVDYPFRGKVFYYTDHERTNRVEMEFEINKPGSWEIIIKTKKRQRLDIIRKVEA